MPLPAIAAVAPLAGAVSRIAGKIPVVGGVFNKLTRTPAHKRAARAAPALVAAAQAGDENARAELARLATYSATSKSKAVYRSALDSIGGYSGQVPTASVYTRDPSQDGGGGGAGLGDLARVGLGVAGAIGAAQQQGRADRFAGQAYADPGNPYSNARAGDEEAIRRRRESINQALRGF